MGRFMKISAGKVMLILAWIAGIILATQFFGGFEKRQHNPNAQPVMAQGAGYVEVQLQPNRQNHFVLSGSINGYPVDFLLDTGATDVAVPQALASTFGLTRGAALTLNTANGQSVGYRTQIAQLKLGAIELNNVRALVAPGMQGNQVLLGMSALKQLEFTQRAGILVLRHYTDN